MFSLILLFNSHLPLTGQKQHTSSTAALYQNGSLAHVKQASPPARGELWSRHGEAHEHSVSSTQGSAANGEL